MAVGDRIVYHTGSLANNGYVWFDPGSNVYWNIQNITTNGKWDLYIYDESVGGGTAYPIEVDLGANGVYPLTNVNFYCDSTRYYGLKNTSGGAIRVHYDGVQIGNTVAFGHTTLAALSTYDVRPAAGKEWVIVNLHSNVSTVPMDITINDASTTISLPGLMSGGGSLINNRYNLTNSEYITMINNSAGTSSEVFYNGIVTK
jgi:hypothetical protein